MVKVNGFKQFSQTFWERAFRFDQKVKQRVFGPRPGYILGIGGSGAEIKSSVDFYIKEAQRVADEGRIETALTYLLKHGVVEGYFKEGDLHAAEICLNLAQEIYGKANFPRAFYYGLDIAEFNFRLGRKSNAEVWFSRIFGKIENEGNQHVRDDIRFAAAMTYISMGRMEDSIRIAREMEDLVSKFGALLNGMVPAFLKAENAAAAKECLLIDCVQTARAQKDYYFKVGQLIHTARKLVEMGEVMDAEKILDEAVASLSHFEAEDHDKFEEIAILLAKIGKEQKAINLLTVWNMRGMDFFSKEKCEDYKLRSIVESRYSQKFFESQRNSLLPKVMKVYEREMDSWRDNTWGGDKSIDPAEAKRVDLPILEEILKSSTSRFRAAWRLLDRMAENGIDPKYTLHALKPALENFRGKFKHGGSEEDFEKGKDIDSISEFVKKVRRVRLQMIKKADPYLQYRDREALRKVQPELQEALWYEIPLIVEHFRFRDLYEFSSFLLGDFRQLYIILAQKGFELKKLRAILPVLAQKDNPEKEMSKLIGSIREGKDPVAILKSK